MNSSFAIGSYAYGNSCIHRLNAQVKIILTCVFSVSIFFVSSWFGLLFYSLLVAGGYALSKIRLSNTLSGITSVLFIMIFTIIAHAATGSALDFPVIFPWINQSLYVSSIDSALDGVLCGLANGVFFALRIGLLIVACSLLSFTTSPVQITQGLRRILFPFRFFKIPVDDICLVISIALRFIPIVSDESHRLRRSLDARCAHSDGLFASLSVWGRIFVLLIVRLFQRADILATALDARCYGEEARGSLKNSRASRMECIWCGIACGALIVFSVLL